MPGSSIRPMHRSAVPWLYGLAVLLTIVSPLVFLGVWVAEGSLEGFGAALLVAVADLVAATIAAVVATVLAAQRGVRRVRTVVLGHPDGRSGRLAEHRSARWALARDRFAALQRDYAAFESDPRAVAARPALVDVSVPATERFVEALADAQLLATATEPVEPRRGEFVAAVDHAVDAWDAARRHADLVAAGPVGPDGRSPWSPTGSRPRPTETRAPHLGAPPEEYTPADEYAAVAEAVKQAAARGMRDLRGRLRA